MPSPGVKELSSVPKLLKLFAGCSELTYLTGSDANGIAKIKDYFKEQFVTNDMVRPRYIL